MAQGGPLAIAYAAPAPRAGDPADVLRQLRRRRRTATPEELGARRGVRPDDQVGWGRPEAGFRRVFTSLMIPGATEEQMSWLDELQRVATSAENAVLSRRAARRRPTRRPAARARAADAGAARPRGPDERLREGPASWPRASPAPGWWPWRATTTSCSGTSRPGRSSSRGRGVPGRGPRGRSPAPAVGRRCCPARARGARPGRRRPGQRRDRGRADLSVRTVERHLQNVYAKLGVSGPSAAPRLWRAARRADATRRPPAGTPAPTEWVRRPMSGPGRRS